MTVAFCPVLILDRETFLKQAPRQGGKTAPRVVSFLPAPFSVPLKASSFPGALMEGVGLGAEALSVAMFVYSGEKTCAVPGQSRSYSQRWSLAER